MWDVHRPIISKNFQFISVDFPGFGESSLNGDITTTDAIAEQLEQLLQRQKITDQIILTGVSMGGYVAFRYFARYPQRLRALALVATKATPDTDAVRQKRAENIQLIEREGLNPFSERMIQSLLGQTSREKHPEIVDEVRGWILQANPKAVCASLRGLAARPDSSSLLCQIEVPTLVLSGQEDGVTPVSEMKHMADQIKNVDYQLLPSCGHLLPIENSDGFRNNLLSFLKRRVL